MQQTNILTIFIKIIECPRLLHSTVNQCVSKPYFKITFKYLSLQTQMTELKWCDGQPDVVQSGWLKPDTCYIIASHTLQFNLSHGETVSPHRYYLPCMIVGYSYMPSSWLKLFWHTCRLIIRPSGYSCRLAVNVSQSRMRYLQDSHTTWRLHKAMFQLHGSCPTTTPGTLHLIQQVRDAKRYRE